MFKVGLGNDLGLSYKCYAFGFEMSMVKVTGSQSTKYIEGDRVASASYCFPLAECYVNKAAREAGAAAEVAASRKEAK